MTRRSALALADRLFDATIVPGYTSVGFHLRSQGWTALPRMDGRVVLVTGATAGIGRAAAEGLARLGASVRLLARDADRGERACEEISRATGSEDLRTVLCDVSDLASVRSFAEAFTAVEPRLDVLVNNAGVLPRERSLSPDGFELTFATNVLGPFLLTGLLLPLLRTSAPSRIVNVSSGGMYSRKIDVEDLQSERGEYDGPAVYARTKRAQVILTEMLAERLAGSGVVVHSMHPGWADTPGVQSSLPRFRAVTRPLLRDAAQAADTILWLAAAEEPARSSGGFWHDRRRRPTHRVPWTRETPAERAALWEACERLCGLHGGGVAA